MKKLYITLFSIHMNFREGLLFEIKTAINQPLVTRGS